MRVDRASGLTDAHHFSAALWIQTHVSRPFGLKILDSNLFVFYMQTGDASFSECVAPN